MVDGATDGPQGAKLWYKHCMRGSGSVAQGHRECINYHDTFWLSNRRAEQSAGRTCGKTRLNLRATAAHISHRYQESVLPVCTSLQSGSNI